MIPGIFAAQGGGGSPSPGGDPYWANVVSLLHFNGTDGSTVFPDQKGRIWTPVGNSRIDTSQSKFGGASGLFDGTGDCLQSPHSADWHLHGKFTVEAWIRPNTVSKQMSICSHRENAGLNGFMFQLTAAGKLGFQYSNNNPALGNSWVNFAGATTLGIGVWSHVAATFDDTTLRLFINGVLDGSTTTFAGSRADTVSTPLYIGRDRDGNTTRDWNGHIDELRVTNGAARYTSSFTPPDEPFPNGPA